MSNSKNKTEKAAQEKPEPKTKKTGVPKMDNPPPPTTRRGKKPVPDIGDSTGHFASQRVAEVETDENVTHTIAPIHTVVTVSEPVVETVEHITIPQVEEEVKERAVGVWGKVKALWHKYAWILILTLFATVIVFIWIEVNRGKTNKAAKQTQQTEQQQQDARDRLQQSETNLQDMQHRRVDSNYRAALEQLRKASDQYEAYHAQMIERNEMYKQKNDALQEKIRNASDDSLLRIGRQLSK